MKSTGEPLQSQQPLVLLLPFLARHFLIAFVIEFATRLPPTRNFWLPATEISPKSSSNFHSNFAEFLLFAQGIADGVIITGLLLADHNKRTANTRALIHIIIHWERRGRFFTAKCSSAAVYYYRRRRLNPVI